MIILNHYFPVNSEDVICIVFPLNVSVATRDYEELRRRFQDSVLERERMSQKLQNATVQLDALRNGKNAEFIQRVCGDVMQRQL